EVAQIAVPDDLTRGLRSTPHDIARENTPRGITAEIGFKEGAGGPDITDGSDCQHQMRLQVLKQGDFFSTEPSRAIGNPGGEHLAHIANRHAGANRLAQSQVIRAPHRGEFREDWKLGDARLIDSTL